MSDLTLRNLFIADPAKAVTKLINEIVDETKQPPAMTKLLYTHNYMDTIMHLYPTANANLKDAILQLVGNMLASVDPQLVDLGKHFVSNINVFSALEDESTAKNAAFLVLNYVRAAAANGVLDTAFIIELTGVYGPEFLTRYPPNAWHDLLWAAIKADAIHSDIYSVDFALELISNSELPSHISAIILRMISEKSMEDLGHYAEVAYSKICDDVLCNLRFEHDSKMLKEALFALSNIVVEPGMADLFFDDSRTYVHVLELSTIHPNSVKWVLANAAVKATYNLHEIRALLEEAAERIGSADSTGLLKGTIKHLDATAGGTPAVYASPSVPPMSPRPMQSADPILFDIQELRYELEKLKQWQERISKVINI